MVIMRKIGLAWVRPLLRQLSSPRVGGRVRALQRDAFRGRRSLGYTNNTVRWSSTLGDVEIANSRTSKTHWQSRSDVQHVSVIQQSDHDYETLLCSPCGISTCSEEELVFIADTSHHRIIIMNGSGRVLDYIGSVAGFEDGSFEFGRLRRPSSIVYDQEKKCIYIADRENHAIRKADLSSRILDTIYPVRGELEQLGLVQRLLRRFRLTKMSMQMDENAYSEHQLAYPYHLAMQPSGHILAATQGFEKLWTVEIGRGEVTLEFDQEPATIFNKFMDLKAAELGDSGLDWMHVHEMLVSNGLASARFSNMMSQVAVLRTQLLVLDQEMHQVVRMDLSSGEVSTMQLSNIALLGLPAWWHSEDNLRFRSSLEERHNLDRPEEAVAVVKVQPGRCMTCVDVILPRGTVLAEPFTDDCLWRQGRGSLVELSTFEGELISHRVTIAQQYVDDLYAMEDPNAGKSEDPAEDLPFPEQSPSGLPFYFSVDVSLGTGEVVFDAVLYLKGESSGSDNQSNRSQFTCGSGSLNNSDDHLGFPVSTRTSFPFPHKLKDFRDGAIMVKHLSFRIKFEGSADAPEARLVLLDVQL